VDIEGLRNFVAVVRAGSFAAAARDTGVPRSTLSKRVQLLEASLDLRLIERTTRNLRLTTDGELFLERAARLVTDADDLERLMRERIDEPRGRLRVSVPVMLVQELLGQVAAAYAQRWPSTEINAVLTDRYSDLIEEDFDCAIRVGPLKDSSNIARRLTTSHTILVAAPALAQDQQTPNEPKNLLDWPTIAFAPAGRTVSWMLENADEQFELSPQSAITFGSLHAIRAAAIAGGGVALIPALVAKEALANGRLIRLLPDWHGIASGIHVVYPSRRYVSARLRAFIDLLSTMLADAPFGDHDR
jgi:DNA-binding transcriptional LysR family regulator